MEVKSIPTIDNDDWKNLTHVMQHKLRKYEEAKCNWNSSSHSICDMI